MKKTVKTFLVWAAISLAVPLGAMAQRAQSALTASSSACATVASCVVLNLAPDSQGGAIQITGTFIATVQFEATSDGGTWVALSAGDVAGTATATSATAAGIWQFSSTGLLSVRARLSSYTSGAVNVALYGAGGGPTAVNAAVLEAIYGAAVLILSDTGAIKTAVESTAPVLVESVDPCSKETKTVVPFSISSATTTELANASTNDKLYVCGIVIVVGGANNVALVEDDTDACASPSAGMSGGTTAATGWNFAANGGLVALGPGLMQTSVINRYVCLMTSTTAQASGTFSYVLAP